MRGNLEKQWSRLWRHSVPSEVFEPISKATEELLKVFVNWGIR